MKICLDAGHYGKYNQSPANPKYYESDIAWKLHLLQKKYLDEYGIEVITTRSSQDTDRGLYDRGAASRGCDLFISDHTNAVGSTVNNKVDYPAAYCAIDGSADGIGMRWRSAWRRCCRRTSPPGLNTGEGKTGTTTGCCGGRPRWGRRG